MAESVLYVDAYDTSQLEFQVESIGNWRDGLDAIWPTIDVPGRFGVLITGTDPSYKPRDLIVSGAVLGSTMSEMLTNLDKLKWKLGRGEKTFTLVDSSHSREFTGRVTKFSATGIQPMMSQRGTKISFTVMMPDPRIFDSSTQNIGSITTSPVDMPMGTAPVRAVVTVAGSGSFTLYYRNSVATEVGSMTITGASAPVTIDMDAQTIEDAGGNAVDKLTSGDFFAFDPDDGNFLGSVWPTLEVTSGTASVTYKKAYL